MFSPSEAKHVCASSARGCSRLLSVILLMPAVIIGLAGCQPKTNSLVEADPADPAAGIRPIHVRATTSPYVSLRPASPAPWRERNDDVAPRSGPDRQER
jgi:hypothetical protein